MTRIVLFTQKSCAPCKRMIPHLRKLAIDAQVIDCQEHPEIAAKFKVTTTPTLLMLRDGKVVKSTHRSLNEAQLEKWLSTEGA